MQAKMDVLALSSTLLLLIIPCACQEYYVSPSELSDSECPSPGNCHQFNYYASNASELFTTGQNISLLFFDGVYELSNFPNLSISMIGSLIISPLDISADSNITLIGASIILKSIVELKIQRILFIESNLDFELLGKLTVENSDFHATNFSLNFPASLKLSNSVSIEIFTTNFIGNSETTFAINSPYQTTLTMDNVGVFEYSQAVVINTQFSGLCTVDLTNSIIKGLQSGLVISSLLGSYLLTVEDTVLADGDYGIVHIDRALQSKVSLHNITVINSSRGLTVIRGPGLTFEMEISHSKFMRNEIGLIVANFGLGSFDCAINDTVFIRNINAATIACSEEHELETQFLTLKNVSFIHNIQLSGLELSGPFFGSISVRNIYRVYIEDCLFDSNKGYSTFISRSSSLVFSGSTTMSNNIGINGGALVILSSVIWLNNQSTIRFINNTALEVGGAILFEEDSIPDIYGLNDKYSPCSYQLAFTPSQPIDPKSFEVTIEFYNNTAPTGGDHIYGAALKSRCEVTPDGTVTSNQIADHIFKFLDNSSSPVSSTPRRVCLCKNGVPNCIIPFSKLFFPISITPGEKFSLNVAIVGNDFGITTGSVYALDTLGAQSEFSFAAEETLQRIQTRECVDLQYSVHIRDPNTKNAGFLLSTNIITATSQQVFFTAPGGNTVYDRAVNMSLDENYIDLQLLTAPVIVNITILDCPPGLVLGVVIPGTFQCVCSPQIEDFVNNCSVVNNSGLLSRNGTVWIGLQPQTSGVILADLICPIQYCRSEHVWIELNNSDSQCVEGRQGILCGECIEGYSVAIGSSRCVSCTNNNGVAYTLLFALLGIVLVAIMKYLDLTLAQATMNGLIFYANVLWINQEIFFPINPITFNTHDPLLQYHYFLRVFIAWLNFDFGIETCFVQGLNAYYKTWLQFIFPIYICLIALFIAVLASRSTRATRFFGKNTVHVLPTLFFFSCSKFLRTIASSFNATQVEQFYPKATLHVWTLDGNVPYFASVHALLFLVALCFGVLIVLYCALLLGAGFLYKVKHRKVCEYVNKFRPLLEAHTGPFNDNYQFWLGLTLLFRIILVIVNVILEAISQSSIISTVTTLIFILLLIVNRVYRKVYVSVLEVCFLLNLGIVCVAFLASMDQRYRRIVICVSTSISFLVFIAIIIGHVYLRVRRRFDEKLCFKRQSKGVVVTSEEVQLQQGSSVFTSTTDFQFFTRSSERFRDDILEEEL